VELSGDHRGIIGVEMCFLKSATRQGHEKLLITDGKQHLAAQNNIDFTKIIW
jgi:hypothetical protein